ncbi:MAG: bifunctional glycosyltransferase family 2/GtrA family protein [Bacilli bacterium]|nr:bifunctional glycosyltransferase family 2/GtrA family protein [Bacilli bacterium]
MPNDKVVPFLKRMDPKDFSAFVVVDDGSGEASRPLFDEIRALPGFEVISYPKNAGKGHALKTAFEFIQANHPDIAGVVTADGDGQHAYEDILRVRDALEANPDSLIMGVRDFSGKGVPRPNRWGNRFSSLYFLLAAHVKLRDTQTGLRGIPASLFPLALRVGGFRYDYEMNFLLEAARETRVVQLGIQTIYDDNKDSHFNPVVDSFRIYRTPILYALVALASFGVDEGLAALFFGVLPELAGWKIALAILVSRLVSGPLNFCANNFLVFPHSGDIGRKIAKYAALYFVNMGVGIALVYAFDYLPSSLIVIKIVVDAILFVINYFVQLVWVFAKKRTKETEN